MEPNEIKKEDTHSTEVRHGHGKGDSPLRTYSTDLAKAVRKDEMAVIKVALEQELLRKEEESTNSPASSRNKTYITLGILIILLTLGGVAGTYYIKKNRTPDVVITETKIPTLINAEGTTSIEVGGLADSKIIEITKSTIANVAGQENQITNIYFTDSRSGAKKIIPTNEFLAGMKSAIPQALIQTLSANFMLGLFTKDNLHHPFLILKTNDFQTAFANMYDWEKNLFSDFFLPFSLPSNADNFTTKWTDLLVENKDTRVLKQDDGTIILLYGFADDKTLIITDGQESFKEVITRVQSTR